ncbi:MAG: GNAT family N-acetyltransferase [Chloroflexi bacterium]|nr:GNAT family N-acetyltransferase [Chloroflexota bacterium]MCC6893921.1 GNAT family N-acetyltransferase [Anaerolineae bacterium]
MTLTVQPAAELPLLTLCELINSSFKGYVAGDFHFTLPTLTGFMTPADVNLSRSLVALQEGEPAGIAMLARRGWTVRIALMGVAEGFQNQGVGRWLLGQVIDAAKAVGDKSLVLEVIEQNPRAVHLYESCGFTKAQRLMGFDYKTSGEGQPIAGTPHDRIDILEVARHVAAWESPDLPWQFSGITLAKSGPPSVAYHVDGCYAVCSNPEAETITLQGLAVPPERQRKGVATRLVADLVVAHPGKHWRVPPICPEKYAPIFLNNGFSPNPLTQFQMELRL